MGGAGLRKMSLNYDYTRDTQKNAEVPFSLNTQCFCLFAQHYSKSNQQIFMKFFKHLSTGQKKKLFDFGKDFDHTMDNKKCLNFQKKKSYFRCFFMVVLSDNHG